jgi:hypothetical protein
MASYPKDWHRTSMIHINEKKLDVKYNKYMGTALLFTALLKIN